MSYPTRISATELHDLVSSWHHTPEDLYEGDLSERVWRYDVYELTKISLERIDLEEWCVHDDLVEDFSSRLSTGSEPPPIVFDPESESVIDGINRANALHRAGRSEILAYVGVGEPASEDEDEDWE